MSRAPRLHYLITHNDVVLSRHRFWVTAILAYCRRLATDPNWASIRLEDSERFHERRIEAILDAKEKEQTRRRWGQVS